MYGEAYTFTHEAVLGQGQSRVGVSPELHAQGQGVPDVAAAEDVERRVVRPSANILTLAARKRGRLLVVKVLLQSVLWTRQPSILIPCHRVHVL